MNVEPENVKIGDLIRCCNHKDGEPEVGEVGVIVKIDDKGYITASVPNRGRGRIYPEDWLIVSKMQESV